MSGQQDEHERTLVFAEIAFAQIKALRQPASPRHYEIWYAYATGYDVEYDTYGANESKPGLFPVGFTDPAGDA